MKYGSTNASGQITFTKLADGVNYKIVVYKSGLDFDGTKKGRQTQAKSDAFLMDADRTVLVDAGRRGDQWPGFRSLEGNRRRRDRIHGRPVAAMKGATTMPTTMSTNKEGITTMKKLLATALLAAAALTAAVPAGAGLNPGTGILQTSHDLSSATGRGALYDAGVNADPTLDRVCIYCHAPHHTITTAEAAAADITYYPLWNHDITTIATWTPYQNTDPDEPGHPGQRPAPAQRDARRPREHLAALPELPRRLGRGQQLRQLRRRRRLLEAHRQRVDHRDRRRPLRDRRRRQPPEPPPDRLRLRRGRAGGRRDPGPLVARCRGDNPYGLTISDLLWGGRMECSSCHDVHNTKNTGSKFLWVADTHSNLCFSCHPK